MIFQLSSQAIAAATPCRISKTVAFPPSVLLPGIRLLSVLMMAGAFLVSPAFGQAGRQAAPPKIEIKKITPSLVSSPDFNAGKKGPRDAMQWLEIEVEFTVETDKAAGGYLDELIVRYHVAFDFKMLEGGAENPLAGKVLTAEVHHVDVKATSAGLSRYSVIYLAPRKIDRMTGGKNILPTNINVAVEILSPSSPQPLAVDAVGTSKGTANWWGMMQQAPGILDSREDTPFSVLSHDRYEPVKPRGAR